MGDEPLGRFRLPRGALRPVLLSFRLLGWLPTGLQRWFAGVAGAAVPVPRGVRVRSTSLGGVPAARVEHPGTRPGRAVLYLHGGAYVAGSTTSHRGIAARISREAQATVYLLDYRLAPEHPFPAALDDAATAFRALREDHVALAGDSAGAGLALAAAVRLRDEGSRRPAAIALISPWLDLTLSGASVRADESRDAMLSPRWLRRSAAGYRGATPAADPGVSPLHADLAGLPPLHVIAGGDEVLVSDADELVARARQAGGAVRYRREPGLWHDYPVLAGLLVEADAAVTEIGAGLRAAWGESMPTVAIIGAGFSGIGMGIALRRAGFDSFTIFEKADDLGGVWRDNTYPGAACDVPSHLYSFSFEPHADWSRRFSPQPDILAYLRGCAEKYGVADRVRLGTEVTDADFDEATGRWQLRTAGGEIVEADVLVPACGQLSRPARPDVRGLGSFTGRAFHSARWEHDHDLTGRRVAVIGTGASAIQFVPAIAADVERLTIFQRSAPYLIPKPDRRYRRWHGWMFRRLPATRAAARLGFWTFFETLIIGLTRFRPLIHALRLVYEVQLRLQVRDGAKRAVLTPDYVMGCKRVLISTDFYRAANRRNVELVPDSLAEITPTGVRTASGRTFDVDTIIFGTGFATQDYLAPLNVRGLGGVDLNEAWRDGARAYLGLNVPGFPNMFVLYGPNTNLGSGSIIHMLERQFHYVLEALRKLDRGDASFLDVRPEVDDAFDREMQRRLADSVWVECQSWYRRESGRVTNNWPGFMREYRKRTRALDSSAYRLIVVSSSTTTPPPSGL